LQQFNFKCVRNDEVFQRLAETAQRLGDDVVMNEATVADCKLIARRLARLLNSDSSASKLDNELLQDLELFSKLSQAAEVWAFVREKDWFGVEGLRRFGDEYRTITHSLQGEEQETHVLDQLDTAVRYISVLMQHQGSTFTELIETIRNQRIVTETGRRSGFSELMVVQQNISTVKLWFTVGMGEMEAIFDQFRSIEANGQYQFRFNHGEDHLTQLQLHYLVEDQVSVLALSKLNEMVQRLGFVQHDTKAENLPIKEFLAQHQLHNKTFAYMHELGQLGHPGFQSTSFDMPVLQTTTTDVATYSKQQADRLAAWKNELIEQRAKNPLMLLFTTGETRALFELITADDNRNTVREISSIVSRIVQLAIEEVQLAVKEVVPLIRSEVGSFACWPLLVGEFLLRWHTMLEAPPLPLRPPTSKRRASLEVGIVIHSLACTSNDHLLRLLLYIYKNRLPEGFEVLNCNAHTSQHQVNLYLQRVQQFPGRTFTLIRVDRLSTAAQEMVLNFLLGRKSDNESMRVHCIQSSTGGSVLQPAPWIRLLQWNNEGTGLPSTEPYTRLVVSPSDIASVTAVISQMPGAGKTHWIRKHVEEVQGSGVTHRILAITEAFDVPSILEQLGRVPLSQTGVVICFQIQLGFFSSGPDVVEIPPGLSRLMSCINDFFYSLLVLRSIENSDTGMTYTVPTGNRWRVVVEVPSRVGHVEEKIASLFASDEEWLLQHLPILAYTAQIVNPSTAYDIDADVRRVCKYLRAYQDGTIDRKFGSGGSGQPKKLIFLMDDSGSMSGAKAETAVDNMLKIYDDFVHDGDHLAFLRFSKTTETLVALQHVEGGRRGTIRTAINQGRQIRGGGTQMYSGIEAAISAAATESESWIICLTDGCSGGTPEAVEQRLAATPNIHLIIIGIGLSHDYVPTMERLCHAHDASKGNFIPTGASLDALNGAFATAAAMLPVSQTFDLDGELNDAECRQYLAEYMPAHIAGAETGSMLLQRYWVAYLHRRVLVFDESPEFNYNQKHDNLGSILMATMLREIAAAMGDNHRREWRSEDHQQLIYDFSHEDGPRFGLICTAPDLMNADLRAQYESLDFEIPTCVQLHNRDVLDSFLAQAMNLKLDSNGRIPAIDEHRFVLTLDFVLKLLNIHERVACRIPCIMEGETGVSKTALTNMYSILVNEAEKEKARASTFAHLCELEDELVTGNFLEPDLNGGTLSEVAARVAGMITAGSIEASIMIGQRLLALCMERGEAAMFAGADEDLIAGVREEANEPRTDCQEFPRTGELLQWFAEFHTVQSFFEINVHAALTSSDVVERFKTIRRVAERVHGSGVALTVFLDEVNSSSCMGLFKEIVVDHSLAGERLPDNVVVIAACNPARSIAAVKGGVNRHDDLGKDWASGHYQVHPLPRTMHMVKWNYGSLGLEQEKEFIQRRLEMLDLQSDALDRLTTAELISSSQQMIRMFAVEHIQHRLMQQNAALPKPLPRADVVRDADEKAHSVVSLRDIQRVFSLYQFFLQLDTVVKGRNDASRRALLLTIGVVYYLRLGPTYRVRFLGGLENIATESLEQLKLDTALEDAMQQILDETEVPQGIARTTGLKENVFMTFVCALSRVPLIIIGPPGSSKTLSVNIVTGNANGEESRKAYYRQHPRLDPFHYQCSRLSTSTEIESVFKMAIERQSRHPHSQLQCLVFMDEAGLPEEEQESLKVLHYFLEGHMSTVAEVGFVAITNHVLDAAKSNRCMCLLRSEPDSEELQSIANGCLFDESDFQTKMQLVCGVPSGCELTVAHLIDSLCRTYTMLLNDTGQFTWFETRFGLRDFIHALKLLRRLSTTKRGFAISIGCVVQALERNFNGVEQPHFEAIVHAFVFDLCGNEEFAQQVVDEALRNTVDIVRDALSDCGDNLEGRMDENCPRYKLIIDESNDDSMMRLLQNHGLVDFEKRGAEVFKLSDFPEDGEIQKVNLVSGVKYAALQGQLVVLSQTDTVNESFYDLFNQHFTTYTSSDGNVRYSAKIAVGAMSKPCFVDPHFQCIVHMRLSDFEKAPAPFLNRFEKYRLSQADILCACLARVPPGVRCFLEAAQAKVQEMEVIVGTKSFFGGVRGQTLESVFVDMVSG
jgi:hypothetical protein